jgi:glyoxylase-like metal-dependent hydrolase (beta-lactamase superfamily II)
MIRMTSQSTPAIIKMGATNCYLIKCEKGYMLIDTSFPIYYERFIKELNRLNVDVSEIKYLLLTHHHDDHAGFAAKMKEIAGCRLIVHKNSVEPLRSGSMIYMNHPLNIRVKITMAIFNKLKKRTFRIDPVILDDEDIVYTGEDDRLLNNIGIDGKIIYTPGHTIDSISVVLDSGDAFVGDICMNFLNFCGIHYRPIWLYDEALVLDSWRKIIGSGARTIYPAHGEPFTVDGLIRYEKLYAAKCRPSADPAI